MRELNRRLVLETIRQKPGLSRYEIAKEAHLSPATASAMVSLLLNDRWVMETGTRNTSVGRKPKNLKYNPNAAYVIGGYIETDRISMAKINLNGQIVQELEQTEVTEDSPARYVLDEIVRLIQELIIGKNNNNSKVLMISLAVPGIMDVEKGINIFSPPFSWRDVQFKEILEKRIGIPVYVDNDDRLAALGEKGFGVGRDVDNLIYIDVESGVGSGIILGGEIYRGTHNAAGEIGHTIVVEDGPKCDCGNYGCLEAIIDNHAIIREVKEKIRLGQCPVLTKNNVPKTVSDISPSALRDISTEQRDKGVKTDTATSIKDIVEAANSGDPGCREVLGTAGGHLARVTANLINAFDPRAVIFTGTLFREGDYFFNLVKGSIMKNVFNAAMRNLRIERSQLGNKAFILGAGMFVLQKVLKNPFTPSP
jgi:predicted NBD/HSP70 family sugar kinase